MIRRNTGSGPWPASRTLLFAVVLAVSPLCAVLAVAGYEAGRSQASARHMMAASAHPLATRAGLEILANGGNAVDAAVAMAFAIGVVEPHASGIGGEGMMMVFLAESKTAVAIDYKSMASAGKGSGSSTPRSGYGAAAVPGSVAGLCMAVQSYGSRPLSEVIAPAVRLAENGFEASAALAAAVTDRFETVLADEPLAAVFCPHGLPIEQGATLRMPELAATLRRIGNRGEAAFYQGETARAIAEAAAAGGGGMTVEELAAYRPVVRTPLRGRYRGYDVVTAPGPTGGLAVLETLNVLGRFNIGRRPPLSPETVHLVTEALRRGYSDYRRYVGDPAFVDVPVKGLLSRSYRRRRAATIRLDAISAPVVTAGEPPEWESPSTTSLVAVDAAGNLVALTQTLSDHFGAAVMVPGTGIILNNEMKNFSSKGSNVYAPGKRPRTTIAPTLIFRKSRPVAALATPGSSRIVATTTLVVVNLLDFHMELQEAVDAPRYFARDTDQRMFVEASLPQKTVESLSRLGYSIEVLRERDPFFGGVQAVVIDPKSGLRFGAADPRRDGTAEGL
jgi:gamma-glutamyltranspeptidase/glutathione hydrolase